ncbi:DUF4350 domain-containing protein [Actinomadura scrupuli]|uniref:DUF4350 domain-containing protein n=1 Tax=Actinomadura scrupuli TaxID=559629 RepID=UPI003D961D77
MSTTLTDPGPALTAEPPSAGQIATRRWRRWRGILLFVLVLVLLGLVLAALRPRVQAQYLDPETAGRDGARALAQIVGGHGTQVTVSRSAADAADRMRTTPDAVLVVVRAERLTEPDLRTLRSTPGDLLLVEPTRTALATLVPGVEQAGPAAKNVVPPACGLTAATLAGDVGFDYAMTYEVTPQAGSATTCYPEEEHPRLVQLAIGGRQVTVLGSGGPLTNGQLLERGNAALGMNLVGGRPNAVWLIPGLPEQGAGGDKSIQDLVPFGVKLAVLQLMIALLLVALWRARRLGPVVTEPLPVIVRSAETVEGRARLYRAQHARDRAADALRSGARERLVPRLGLPRSLAQDPAAAQEIVTAIAGRLYSTGPVPGTRPRQWDETTIGFALYGPAPADDAGLVGLSDLLDDLERQVLGS